MKLKSANRDEAKNCLTTGEEFKVLNGILNYVNAFLKWKGRSFFCARFDFGVGPLNPTPRIWSVKK